MTIRKTFLLIIALAFQTNHPPMVKMESPSDHAVVAPGAQVSYSIHVSDQEDGDSRYDEINPKEVLLEVRRLQSGGAAGTEDAATSGRPSADAGLDIMAGNNCFNCHLFKAKLLGPSFFDIATKYAATKAVIDTLTRRVRDGSAGVWGGSEKMPSHPELSVAAVRSTVQWILRNGARQDRTFYNGISGLLRFPRNQPGTYSLIASYTDHGTKDQPGHRLKGIDRITVTVR